MAPLILILYAYLRKIERGGKQDQAAREAMKALRVQFPAYLDRSP